jgi:PleD family two-component response regulator
MSNKVLVIQETQTPSFDDEAFVTSRNLIAEYCSTESSALSAITNARYRCVVVSMDMQREDPIAIISALRGAENTLGLSPTQILVAGKARQPTQSELAKFNISAHIRSHHLK